jgi:ferredoxin/flavodoxin---NADP+ reductase
MEEQMEIYDITIIGGGPVGLFTAFYGGMRQGKVKILESLPQLGGQLSALYPEKYIYDIAGFPKIRAIELIEKLKEQMMLFKPKVCLGEAVQQIEKQEDETFKLITDCDIHLSKSIIITAGNGAFKPRKLEIEDAKHFENSNLHYFVDDINKFKGRNVAILGGGDSAIDWALMLESIAKKVTLIHRRDGFRAHEHSVEKLINSSIEIKTPYTPKELIGSTCIKQLIIEHIQTKNSEVVNVDDLIVNYGFISSPGPIKEWGLKMEKNIILVNSKQETNIPGIYAAGDICTYDGKVKLIVSGFGEGPTAVNNAKAFIDPKAKLQPMHSTSMFN